MGKGACRGVLGFSFIFQFILCLVLVSCVSQDHSDLANRKVEDGSGASFETERSDLGLGSGSDDRKGPRDRGRISTRAYEAGEDNAIFLILNEP